MKTKVLVILGPTASGKSALGVSLAQRFNGEIISADSRQVYKGLDIGTGKITKQEMGGIPHYLLDVASPKRAFSAADFITQGRSAISDISERGKLPIVVGGTGFYIDSLLGRIVLPDVPPNPALRSRLSKKSAAQLYALLKKRDPARAKAMNTPGERNNPVRLIRALEIVSALGRVPKNIKDSPLYNVRWVGIAPSDTILRKNIGIRLFARMRCGMIAEAKKLHNAGLTYKRMTELGLEYRSLARLLQKKLTKAEFQKELESDIWRYARKQISYWRRNKNIKWFEPKQEAKIKKEVVDWLKK